MLKRTLNGVICGFVLTRMETEIDVPQTGVD